MLRLRPPRALSFVFGALLLLPHCIGPDLGSLQNKNKKTNPIDSKTNCTFCQQVPRITAPAHQAILDNTLAEITLAPITAEACEYAFSGATTFTALRKKSAHTITQFTPTHRGPWGR